MNSLVQLTETAVHGKGSFSGSVSEGAGLDKMHFEILDSETSMRVCAFSFSSIVFKTIDGGVLTNMTETSGRDSLWVTRSGAGMIEADRRALPFGGGHAGLGPDGEARWISLSPSTGWILEAPPHKIRRRAEEYVGRVLPEGLSARGSPVDGPAALRLQTTMQRLSHALESAHSTMTAAQLAVVEETALDSIVTGAMPQVLRPWLDETETAVASHTVRRAYAMMRDLHTEPITLSEMAQAVGVTPRAIQHGFRMAFGCTPGDLLRMFRLETARELMAKGRAVSVTEAATDAGFWHLGDFSRAYRRRFGESPSVTLRRARS